MSDSRFTIPPSPPPCPSCGTRLTASDERCGSCGVDVRWSAIGGGGRILGPWSWAGLSQAIAERRVTPSDRVRQGGEGEWEPLEIVVADAAVEAAERPIEQEEPGRGLLLRTRLMGIILLLLLALPFAAGIFYSIGRPRATATARCAAVLQDLGHAVSMYAADYDGRLPPAIGWEAALVRHSGFTRAFVCPAAQPDEPSYFFNPALGRSLIEDYRRPTETVLAADATLGRVNAEGRPAPPRHETGENALFLDGHVKFLPRESPARSSSAPGRP